MEGLLSVLSVPHVGQVHLFYRARLLSDKFEPGHETIEARLFAESEIPWTKSRSRRCAKRCSLFRSPPQGQFRSPRHRHRLGAGAPH